MRRFATSIVCLIATTGVAQCEDLISPLGRQNNSGAYEYFREAVLGKQGRFHAGVAAHSGNDDLLEAVQRTPSAIAYGKVPSGKVDVKMLKVKKGDGKAIAPTVENIAKSKYPLARPIYVYSLKLAGAPKHYLEWVLSKEGQEIAKSEGFVPLADPPAPPADEPPEDTIRIAGSDTMVNVGQKWADAYGKKYPDIELRVSGGGTGTGIAALIAGTGDFAHSTRRITDAENERAKAALGSLEEHVVGYDALAVFVHKDNPLKEISVEQLADIYGAEGEIKFWSDLRKKAETK